MKGLKLSKYLAAFTFLTALPVGEKFAFADDTYDYFSNARGTVYTFTGGEGDSAFTAKVREYQGYVFDWARLDHLNKPAISDGAAFLLTTDTTISDATYDKSPVYVGYAKSSPNAAGVPSILTLEDNAKIGDLRVMPKNYDSDADACCGTVNIHGRVTIGSLISDFTDSSSTITNLPSQQLINNDGQLTINASSVETGNELNFSDASSNTSRGDTSAVFFNGISGTGDVIINSGVQTFYGENTYTGKTIINSGAELRLSSVAVKSSWSLWGGTGQSKYYSGNLSSKTDVVNNGLLQISSQNNSDGLFLGQREINSLTGNGVVFGYGSLAIKNASGDFGGSLFFHGDTFLNPGLRIEGGTQVLSGNSYTDVDWTGSGITGFVEVESGATLINRNNTKGVGNTTGVGGLGIQVDQGGTFIFDQQADHSISNSLSGSGTVQKIGSGTLTILSPTDEINNNLSDDDYKKYVKDRQLIAFGQGGYYTLPTDTTGNSVYRYSGNFEVKEGGLRLETLNGGPMNDFPQTYRNSTITVDSGAFLSGNSGTAGNVVIKSGGIIEAGTKDAPGVLTISGNLTLENGAISNFRSTSNADSALTPELNDVIVVGGNLQLGGTINIKNSQAGKSFGEGIYSLYTYGGKRYDNLSLAYDYKVDPNATVSGSATIHMDNLAPGMTVTLQKMNNEVNAVVIKDPNPTPTPDPKPDPTPPPVVATFWNGSTTQNPNGVISGGNGTWTTGNANWTTVDATKSAHFAVRQTAFFLGSAGVVNVVDSGSAVVRGMVFANNDGKTYLLKGDPIRAAENVLTVRVGNGTFSGGSVSAAIESKLSDGSTSATLEKSDSGNLILSGANTYTGGTNVLAGTLTVNGNNSAATGATSVNSGATLAGTGVVGGETTVHDNAILSPAGSDVGTLSIAKNLAFDNGGILLSGFDGKTTDLVSVAGSAHVNGAEVFITNPGSLLQVGARYTVLNASAGVTGRFQNFYTNAVSQYVYLSPSLNYDSNNVWVALNRNDTSFSGGTRNQSAVGSSLDKTPENNPLVAAVSVMNVPQSRRAEDALSGEIHAAAKTAFIQDADILRSAALGRLATADCADAGYFSATDLRTGKRLSPGSCGGEWVLWGKAYGGFGHNAAEQGFARLTHSGGGFVLGADTQAGKWRVGGLLSYGSDSFSLHARNSSGHANNVSAGIYAGTNWGSLNFRTGAIYTWNAITTRRTIAAPGLNFGKANAGYNGGTAQAFAEVAYKLRYRGLKAEPFANVTYVNQWTGAFHEHGGGAAALRGFSDDTGLTLASFGARLSHSVSIGNASFMPFMAIGYKHAFGALTQTKHMQWAGGTSMDIGAAPVAGSVGMIETGLKYQLSDRINVGVSYRGQYGAKYNDNYFSASAKVAW